MTVYLVQQWRADKQEWEHKGIFSSSARAVAACRSARYAITTFALDVPLGATPIVDIPLPDPKVQP